MMLEKTQTGRIDWIDVAKGIAILAVVVFHIFPNTRSITNLFHVPAFLFISGYLFRPDNRLGFYFKRKFLYFFVPYITFMVVMVLPLELLTINYFSTPAFVKRLVKIFIAANNNSVAATTFWFIPCIFATQQVYNYIAVKFGRRQVWLIVLTCLLAAYLYVYYFKGICLPGRLQTILFTIPYFHLGVVFRDKLETFLNTKIRVAVVLILSAFIFAASYHYSYLYFHILDIPQNNFGIPFVSIVCSMLTILAVCYISKFVAATKGVLFRALSYMGTASLIIMLTHQPIQYALDRYLGMGGVRIIPAILVPVLLFYVFNRFGVSRRLFLGVNDDKKQG